MHGSTFKETLRDFFSEDILPQEYGGSGPSMEEVCQEWTSHILQSEELLTQLSIYPAGDEVTSDPEPDSQSAYSSWLPIDYTSQSASHWPTTQLVAFFWSPIPISSSFLHLLFLREVQSIWLGCTTWALGPRLSASFEFTRVSCLFKVFISSRWKDRMMMRDAR